MPNATNNTQVIDTLQTLLVDGDEVDRCYAIRCLATLQNTQSIKLLVDCLRDDDVDVCVDAAAALGKIGDQYAATKLIESLLNDPDGEIKTACVTALSELGSDEAIPHLLQIAEQRPENIGFDTDEWDAWWDMQLESIKALGNMRVAAAVPVLKKVLDEDDCLDIEDDIYTALAKISEKGNSLLLSILKNGNARARRRVTKALGDSRSSETLKPLARALQDEDPDVRKAALTSLPKRQALPYLPVVLRLFKDENPGVRRQAIQTAQALSLNATRVAEAKHITRLIDKLIPLLHDPDQIVQATVLDTLSNLNWKADKKQLSGIITLLSQCRGDCFSSVCRFIESQQIDEAIPDFLLLLKKSKLDTEEKIHALATLGKLKNWNSDIERILGAYIFDEIKAVRLAALEALAELDQAFPVLSNERNSEERLPFDLIDESLQGSLLPPASKRNIPVTVQTEDRANETTTEDSESRTESADKNSDDEDRHFVEGALAEISQSIEKGEQPHPLSTLDSMAISLVEKELEEQAKRQERKPGQAQVDTLSVDEKQELKEFIALTAANAETAKWLFNKEKVDVNTDIRRLAARIMGKTKSITALDHLLAIYAEEDAILKYETTQSIGQLIKSTTNISDQYEAITQILIEQLNADNRDLRVAAARVLGELGQAAAIEPLLAGFDDKETAMRIQCLHSVSKLANQKTDEQIDLTSLAKQILQQLDSNEPGVHRAVVEALIALFKNKLNDNKTALKQTAIDSLIDAGLSGRYGQVEDMSWGLSALDESLASTQLLAKLDTLATSVERRYIVEMLGELHRPDG